MTWVERLRAWRPGPPLLAFLAAWVALWSWHGMVTHPAAFWMLTLPLGAAMVLAGSLLRLRRVPAVVVAGAQLAVGVWGLDLAFAAHTSLLGLVPTPASLRHVGLAIYHGASALDAYSSPVAVSPTATRAMLVACGLLVVLAVDVLGPGLRRPSLVALPLLVTLAVPISIMRMPLSLLVFAASALLFLRYLAIENLDRFGAWSTGSRSAPRPVLALLWRVALTAVAVSVVAAPLVPVSGTFGSGNDGSGGGDGLGPRTSLVTVNPLIEMRRDLVEESHTPMVMARTTARSTAYLRTTVLDQLTSDEWRPSTRTLPDTNSANGVFPPPPGLVSAVGGTTDRWSLRLSPVVVTPWLPLPYPVRRVSVPGAWRYDDRTLDVAYVGRRPPTALAYTATSFTPTITAAMLSTAARPPTQVSGPMTALPPNVPAVLEARAREVTRGAVTDFAKAVALQDWFRSKGGFTYSLSQRSGSGMDLLAHFVTDDRVGYCEQFAAAMAVMGRALGIPSRVAVGFLDGSHQADGSVLYSSDDRHAWPEMYFSGVGWVRFEPTPGVRSGASPTWSRQSSVAVGATAAPTASPRASRAPRVTTSAAGRSSSRQSSRHVGWSVLAVLALLLLLALVPAGVRLLQRQRRLAGRAAVDLGEGAWEELRATALDLGLSWASDRSPREQARGVVAQVRPEPEVTEGLEQLLVLVERGRYAPQGESAAADPGLRDRTTRTVRLCREAMTRSAPGERGRWGRWWPVSLWRGREGQ